jgi:G3E family GTPase
VIGASSGGIEALQTIARGLTQDLAAAVCVVVQMAPDSPGAMDHLIIEASGILEPTLKQGEAHDLDAARHAQLVHRVGFVGLDCLDTQVEL